MAENIRIITLPKKEISTNALIQKSDEENKKYLFIKTSGEGYDDTFPEYGTVVDMNSEGIQFLTQGSGEAENNSIDKLFKIISENKAQYVVIEELEDLCKLPYRSANKQKILHIQALAGALRAMLVKSDHKIQQLVQIL